MSLCFMFFVNSVLLGVGLAMDAFSVSLANGLNEPYMKKSRVIEIAGVFAFFQALMPMTGWWLVKSLAEKFVLFQRYIPWIALLLLCYIGINMLIEAKKGSSEFKDKSTVGALALIIQGVATSIDALSVGFTISEYNMLFAFISSIIIACVTFVICLSGVLIGKRCGTKLAGKASALGGIILILIGIEIFITGIC